MSGIELTPTLFFQISGFITQWLIVYLIWDSQARRKGKTRKVNINFVDETTKKHTAWVVEEINKAIREGKK